AFVAQAFIQVGRVRTVAGVAQAFSLRGSRRFHGDQVYSASAKERPVIRTLCRRLFLTTVPVTLAVWMAATIAAQSGAPNGQWPTYGGDLGNTRYAPLDQINADNFNKLEVAWRFKTDNLGPRR